MAKLGYSPFAASGWSSTTGPDADRVYPPCGRLALRPGIDLEFISCDHESSYLASLIPRPATVDLGIEARARLAVHGIALALRENRVVSGIQLKVEPALIPGNVGEFLP